MISHSQLFNFYINLTPRQREVVYWVSRGLSNGEVADKLCIEKCGVAGHLTNIYGELATLHELADYPRINRPILIHLFSVFFVWYADLDSAVV